MRKFLLLSGMSAIGIVVVAVYLISAPPGKVPEPAATTRAAPKPVPVSVATATSVAPALKHPVVQNAPQRAPEDAVDPAVARLRAAGLSLEEIKARRIRLRLEAASTERFNDTVKMDGLAPGQVRAEVRQMFRTLQLTPAYDIEQGQAGFFDGMTISELQRSNPLSRVGFKRGDKLVSFDGMPLQDPAEVAHLFADLGKQFEVCANRDAKRICHIISL